MMSFRVGTKFSQESGASFSDRKGTYADLVSLHPLDISSPFSLMA